jgi:rhodanese-related sulfurtransferase
VVKSVTHMLTEARASVGIESPIDAGAELAAGNAVLIDVRQGDEFTSGHIGGSISVPRGLLEFIADPACAQHEPELRPERRIIVVSTTGARAALAAATLQSMGYPDVAVLVGGIRAWVAEGRPLTERAYSST